MSRKRRGFDIDLEADDAPQTDTVAPVSDLNEPVRLRRGPMAAAISETAGSLRDRAVLEAQIRAENDALAHEHVRLKKLGLITELVPLDRIDTWKLTRDRALSKTGGDDMELAELVASVRDIGLSNPIRLEAGQGGRYELVQGYRRLQAYRALLAETGDAGGYGAIPATVLPQGETLERLYRQMVDENLVRKDISFAEMAQMAVHYAADPGTSESDPDKVVAKLFGSAGYTKRSYIRGFIKLIEVLGPDLLYAPHIPRALGLALVARLEAEPGIAALIRAALAGWDGRSVRDELDVLRRFAQIGTGPDGANADGADPVAPVGPAIGRRLGPNAEQGFDRGFDRAGVSDPKARLRFELRTSQGPVQVIAATDRIELRLGRDVTQIDRHQLEAAVRAMMDYLK